MNEIRTWLLDEEVKTTQKMVDEVKKTWPETGVTIMSNGWLDIKQRGIINLLVNNPYGTVFLKSVDASAYVKDAQLLFNMLDEVVDEVGEDIVVQVITDNASAYKATGRMLMEKRNNLYWTPCAAHCIDLMLERLGQLPQHKNALLKAKKVSKFIYNHSWVLSLFRKHSDKEIVRPAVTRFATAFLTLQRIKELRQPLEAMFASEEWSKSSWEKKQEGKEVKKIISRDENFWRGVNYAVKTTSPLVKVLRLVDGEKTPAMGFIYEAMDKAKEEIAKELGGQEASYKEIWDIIDEKWEHQLYHDLHAAGYYLNPQCHYDKTFHLDKEIKTYLYKCMDRLVPSEDYMKVDAQLEDFDLKKGMFGFKATQMSYITRSPERWWYQFGDDTPELKAFAIKVLSLTASASACERNWSAFNQVHTKKRNRLHTSRMNKLMYVMFNKRLKDKFFKLKSRNNGDEKFDPLLVEDKPSDNEWLIEQIERNGHENSTSDDENEATIEGDEAGKSSRSSKRKKKSGSSLKSTLTTIGTKKKMTVIEKEEEQEEDWNDDDNIDLEDNIDEENKNEDNDRNFNF